MQCRYRDRREEKRIMARDEQNYNIFKREIDTTLG